MKMKLLILLFCIGATFFAHGQWYDPDKVNAKAGKIYGQAYEEAQAGRFDASIKHINDALKIDPKFVDAYLSRAGIYSSLKNYTAAIQDFETGLSLDSIYSKPYLLPYSIALAGNGNFSSALLAINRFLTIGTLNKQSIKAGEYRKSCYEFAVDYEKNIR